MTARFTTLLHRAARLRQRFEALRNVPDGRPMHLLRLRALMLTIEERMQRLAAAQTPAPLRAIPCRAVRLHRAGA